MEKDSKMVIEIDGIEHIGRAAERFVGGMGESRVFAFYGEMGAGKTTLIRAICERLGVEDVVASPTFAIVNEYRRSTGEPVYHFDFYRVQRLSDAEAIGLDDYLYSGHVCLIEWPQLVEPVLPEDAVEVRISVDGDSGKRVVEMMGK